jgi:type II secretory pathway component GspD/PulD (secretin)/tetratricopeptide (TPR) repeat protein
MRRTAFAVALSLLLLSPAQPPVWAQADAFKSAEEEAVRRQNAIITARVALEKAQAAQRQGDLLKAGKGYEETLAIARKLGGAGLEKELKAAVEGLSEVNLQLAQMAQRRGDFDEADARVSRILKEDPANKSAIAFKQENAKRRQAALGRSPSPETLARVPQIASNKVEIATMVRDGQLLFQMGKLDEAEAKLKKATQLDPENRAAFYYLNLVYEARYSEEARKREDSVKRKVVEVERSWNDPIKRELLPQPNPMALTNLVHTGKGRQAIFKKLNDIRLNEVFFDGLPLGEVIKFLSDEAKKRDPEKRGINFIINSIADSPSATPAVTVDPATGAAIPVPPSEPVDLNVVTIKIVPPLGDVRLADVLDAITKVADKPIKYSVEDYAVVFTQRRPEPVQLFTRTFRVDPNTFLQGLESVSGVSFGTLDTGAGGQGGGGGGRGGGGRGGGNQGNLGQGGQDDTTFIIPRVAIAGLAQGGQGGFGGQAGQQGGQGQQQGTGISYVTRTNTLDGIQATVRQFFVAAGVNLNPPATLFFNDRSGVLFVRASLQDLDLVEAAIQVLNTAPPQITIEAKFAEITQSDRKALGFDWFLGNTLFGNGRLGVQGGSAPSFQGSPSSANPTGVFPGTPAPPALVPTTIAPSGADQFLTAGLRGFIDPVSKQPGNAPSVLTLTGILTDPQFRVVIRALEQRDGVDLLSAPRVTTLSGRQTQIAIVDVVTVVSGVDLNQQTGGQGQQALQQAQLAAAGVVGTTVEFITQPLPFGPVLDVIPYVAADGYTIHMTIIPTLTEFLGYDDPGAFVPQAQGAAGNTVGVPLTATLPLPRLRARQLATSATVWDGQTVVLGGLITEDVTKVRDKVPVIGDLPLVGRLFRSESRSSVKKNLVIFVTPTIIDPAGNRIHNDDDLPFAREAVPAQTSSR